MAIVRNSADESQVKAREQLQKNSREQAIADMKHMLSQPQFRRFMGSIIRDCRLYRTSFTGNNSEMYYLEGQRSIGLKLKDLIDASEPSAFLKIEEENRKGESDNV